MNTTKLPRGKALGVFRLTHVAGGPTAVDVIRIRGEWDNRADAEKVAAAIDKRLMPTVDLVSIGSDA